MYIQNCHRGLLELKYTESSQQPHQLLEADERIRLSNWGKRLGLCMLVLCLGWLCCLWLSCDSQQASRILAQLFIYMLLSFLSFLHELFSR